MEAFCKTEKIFMALTKVTENKGIRNSILLVIPDSFMKKGVQLNLQENFSFSAAADL